VAVEKYHQKVMNGSAIPVGLNFQEKVEKEHHEKKGGNGDDYREFYRAQHTTLRFSFLFVSSRAREYCDCINIMG
jgi:hypothetical protein